MKRRLVSEGLGTALLVATVVGSGIMGEALAGGNMAVALLANTLATGAGLAVFIAVFGPVSGAHFNPVVSIFEARLPAGEAAAYAVAQVSGGVCGTILAHAMFGLPLIQLSRHPRTGPGQWLSEAVATFGLILAIAAVGKSRPAITPIVVAGYICAAYWYTASTAFANPAVTIARAFTDSFAGIALRDAPGFIVAQVVGALAGAWLGRWLFAGQVTRG